MHYPTIESTLGHTPLVRLQRLNAGLPPEVTVLCKMEGDNPAGSVKDRPAFYMIQGASDSSKACSTVNVGKPSISSTRPEKQFFLPSLPTVSKPRCNAA